ncbi:MAG: hypothetical protein WEB55_03340 [Acidimicrobiia bacterium]
MQQHIAAQLVVAVPDPSDRLDAVGESPSVGREGSGESAESVGLLTQ